MEMGALLKIKKKKGEQKKEKGKNRSTILVNNSSIIRLIYTERN